MDCKKLGFVDSICNRENHRSCVEVLALLMTRVQESLRSPQRPGNRWMRQWGHPFGLKNASWGGSLIYILVFGGDGCWWMDLPLYDRMGPRWRACDALQPAPREPRRTLWSVRGHDPLICLWTQCWGECLWGRTSRPVPSLCTKIQVSTSEAVTYSLESLADAWHDIMRGSRQRWGLETCTSGTVRVSG